MYQTNHTLYFLPLSFEELSAMEDGLKSLKGYPASSYYFNHFFNREDYEIFYRLVNLELVPYRHYYNNLYRFRKYPADYTPGNPEDWRLVVWSGSPYLNYKRDWMLVGMEWLEETSKASCWLQPAEKERKSSSVYFPWSKYPSRKPRRGRQFKAKQDEQLDDKIQDAIKEFGYPIKGFKYQEKKKLGWDAKYNQSRSWKDKKIKYQYLKNMK